MDVMFLFLYSLFQCLFLFFVNIVFVIFLDFIDRMQNTLIGFIVHVKTSTLMKQ